MTPTYIKIKSVNYIFLGIFFTLLSFSVIASENTNSMSTPHATSVNSLQNDLEYFRSALEEQRTAIISIQERFPNDEVEYKNLESKVESIERNLKVIEDDLIKKNFQVNTNLESKITSIELSLHSIQRKDDFFSYADWAAVAVTCVAVLLTIIGIAIAALAIWGYREIINITKSSATSEAKTTAESTMKEMINSVAKNELEKLINDGKLRQPLQDAVDMILRNGSGLNNFDQNRTQEILDELDLDETEFDEFYDDNNVTDENK